MKKVIIAALILASSAFIIHSIPTQAGEGTYGWWGVNNSWGRYINEQYTTASSSGQSQSTVNETSYSRTTTNYQTDVRIAPNTTSTVERGRVMPIQYQPQYIQNQNYYVNYYNLQCLQQLIHDREEARLRSLENYYHAIRGAIMHRGDILKEAIMIDNAQDRKRRMDDAMRGWDEAVRMARQEFVIMERDASKLFTDNMQQCAWWNHDGGDILPYRSQNQNASNTNTNLRTQTQLQNRNAEFINPQTRNMDQEVRGILGRMDRFRL